MLSVVMFNCFHRHDISEPKDGAHFIHYSQMGREASTCLLLLDEPLYYCKPCGKKQLFRLQGVKRHLAGSSKKARKRKEHGIKNPVKGVDMIELLCVGGNTGIAASING
jgi:hypothetical protein